MYIRKKFELHVTMLHLIKIFLIIGLYNIPVYSVGKRGLMMIKNYKNSYKVAEKELVSLSVYNVGFQKCDPLYQWGPGIRDHYLIHYIISGRGYYKLGQQTYELNAGDTFLVYPNTEVTYYAAEEDSWEYAWVGFTGSDASMILKATDFTPEVPFIRNTPLGDAIRRQILHIYDARGNEFEHAVEMTGRLYTCLLYTSPSPRDVG